MSTPPLRQPASEDQLWFIVRESTTSTRFERRAMTLQQIQEAGVTLKKFLEWTNTTGDETKFSSFIHSNGMSAAVQLLNDESIYAVYRLYCQKDPIVTIHIRKVNEPSPNSSRAPSHQKILAERRTVSNGKPVPELTQQRPIEHSSEAVDAITFETITDKEEMVSIRTSSGSIATFTVEYLHGWVAAQLSDGKMITSISVQTYDTDGKLQNINLSQEIWETCLVRGPRKDIFLPIWDNFTKAKAARYAALAELSTNKSNFSQGCESFIFDLRNLTTNKGSRNRLNQSGHEFYLGPPYFKAETVEKLLELPTQNGTLRSDLRSLSNKRMGSEICAAHDLSPMFENALSVSWNKVTGKASSSHDHLDMTVVGRHPNTAKILGKKGSQMFKKVFGTKKYTRGKGHKDDESSGGVL